MSIFKPTFLYIKTHNVTGLKYFGKTVRKDPHSYKGSGTYWIKHIKKHGYDVTTEILGLFLNEEECKRVALDFSVSNDIVKSDKWANLQIEKVKGGWDYFSTMKGIETFRNRPIEEQQRINKSKGRVGEKNGMFGSARFGEKNPRFGIPMTETQKEVFGRKNKGKTIGIDKDGNRLRINCGDLRLKTGELRNPQAGKVIVKDKDGKTFNISVNDPRYLAGELVSINAGKHKTQQEKDHLSKIVSTLRWYTDGISTKRSQAHPGEGWTQGRLKMLRSPK